jgi:hypothetical protein
MVPKPKKSLSCFNWEARPFDVKRAMNPERQNTILLPKRLAGSKELSIPNQQNCVDFC